VGVSQRLVDDQVDVADGLDAETTSAVFSPTCQQVRVEGIEVLRSQPLQRMGAEGRNDMQLDVPSV
jgi:hypothetical protein